MMNTQRKYRCRVCGAEVIAGPYIAPEACGACQLAANAEIERLQTDRNRYEDQLDRLHEWMAVAEDGYAKQAAEIKRLRAIIDELVFDNAKLHRRKCHDCGHAGWYADSRTPYCLCDQCRSQDTRLVKEEK